MHLPGASSSVFVTASASYKQLASTCTWVTWHDRQFSATSRRLCARTRNRSASCKAWNAHGEDSRDIAISFKWLDHKKQKQRIIVIQVFRHCSISNKNRTANLFCVFRPLFNTTVCKNHFSEQRSVHHESTRWLRNLPWWLNRTTQIHW